MRRFAVNMRSLLPTNGMARLVARWASTAAIATASFVFEHIRFRQILVERACALFRLRSSERMQARLSGMGQTLSFGWPVPLGAICRHSSVPASGKAGR